jgi:predicted homoserine dehydrogenase-like protein
VDHLLTYDDVELDEGSKIVQLRRMQDAMAEAGVPSLDDLAAVLRG